MPYTRDGAATRACALTGIKPSPYGSLVDAQPLSHDREARSLFLTGPSLNFYTEFCPVWLQRPDRLLAQALAFKMLLFLRMLEEQGPEMGPAPRDELDAMLSAR